MPHVYPNPPADNVQDPRPRTAPRNLVEQGFGRQLDNEVHKLSDSANSKSAPVRTTISGGRANRKAESQSEAASSNATVVQDVKEERPSPFDIRQVVHPATANGKTASAGQGRDADVEGSGKSSSDAGNLAASNILAVLTVLLFSPIEPGGQNLPTEASVPKKNAIEPDSIDEPSAGMPFANDTSRAPAIHPDRAIKSVSQQLPHLRLIAPSAEEDLPETKLRSFIGETDQGGQNSASLLNEQALPPRNQGSVGVAGVSLQEHLVEAPLSDWTGIQSNSTSTVARERSDAPDPARVLQSSIEASSVQFQNSADPEPNPLSSVAFVTSKSDRYPTATAEIDPTVTEVKGSSDEPVQEEIRKVLTNLLSRDSVQTKVAAAPESRKTVQTSSLSLIAKQTADTKPSKETSDLPVNARRPSPESDLDRQADPALLTSARVGGKGPILENEASSLSKAGTGNPNRELPDAKEGAPGDKQESNGSVARENLRAPLTNPHLQLANRREEAGSVQVASQTDRVSKTESVSRSFTKDERAVMLKEEGDPGTRSLATVGHVTPPTGQSVESGAEPAAPLAGNLWEQVEKAKVIAQLVEKAHLIAGKNDGELVLSLKPDFLGRISLHASMVERALVATLVAESSHVKHLLESQLPVLQHSLQEQGLPVSKVVVLQGNELSFSDTSKGQPNFQQNPESRQATPHLYRHDDSLLEKDEPELPNIGSIPHRPYYSRSLNLIA
jgi:flagellar hook-length control protein FliK